MYRFLRTAYWCPGVPYDVVARSIEHSLCFGLYDADGALAGFGRAVTDRSVFAYLGDVFVVEENTEGGGLERGWCRRCWSIRGCRDCAAFTSPRLTPMSSMRRFGFRPVTDPQDKLDLVRSPAQLWGGDRPGAPRLTS